MCSTSHPSNCSKGCIGPPVGSNQIINSSLSLGWSTVTTSIAAGQVLTRATLKQAGLDTGYDGDISGLDRSYLAETEEGKRNICLIEHRGDSPRASG